MSITVIDNTNALRYQLDKNKIAVEKVWIRNECFYGQCVLAISGRVHVANLTYEKQVFARVTVDNWASFKDYYGGYVESGLDGRSDVFTFGFTRDNDSPVDIEFAVCCIQAGVPVVLWDNNNGSNFIFHLKEDSLNP